MKTLLYIALLSLLAVLPGCTVAGAALGTGAAVGVASQEDGGLSGAADNIRIKALISDLWFRYDVRTFTKLNLTINEGRVLITGVVQNPDNRVEAVRLAWQVEGVKQVINEIRVADSDGFPGYVRDEWITTRLRAALTFDRDVYSINYSIDTVQGTVYLMGVARNQAELDRAIEIARTISGVQQVVSYVKIAGQEVPADASRVTNVPPPSAAAPAPQDTTTMPQTSQPEPLTPQTSGSLTPPSVSSPTMLPP